MRIALWLLAVQGVIGAFDTLYYHQWPRGCRRAGGCGAELQLHAARDFFYAVLFGTLPLLEWPGRGLVLVAVLGAEIVLTLWDFVVEVGVRKPFGDVYAGERVTHAVMGILYGGMLANLCPSYRAGRRCRRRWCRRRRRARGFALALCVMAAGVRPRACATGPPRPSFRTLSWPWQR